MRRHLEVLALLFVLPVLLATACAVGAPASDQQVRAGQTPGQVQDSGRQAAPTASPSAPPAGRSQPEGASTSEDDRSPHARSGAPVGATPSESGSVAPAEGEPTAVPVSASLSTDCVVRGDDITVTISTLPDIAAGYQAIYADGTGGGPPPYGDGHGGNNGGMTDNKGQYIDRWRVSKTAPLGHAEVEVVVAHGGAFGRAWVSFEVVDALSGGCS